MGDNSLEGGNYRNGDYGNVGYDKECEGNEWTKWCPEGDTHGVSELHYTFFYKVTDL